MKKLILGFDIGVPSYFSVFDTYGNLIQIVPIPYKQFTSKESSAFVKKVFDPHALHKRLKKAMETNEIVCAGIEAQWSRPRDARPVAFSLGETYMGVQSVLACLGIMFRTIAPKKWKNYFGLYVQDNAHAKKATLDFVKKKFPAVRESEIRVQKDHNKADAVVIGFYTQKVIYPQLSAKTGELFK